MNTRPQPPTAEEIEGVARLLARHCGAGARKQLRPYLNGTSQWGNALRVVRTLLREALADTERGPKIPLGVRTTFYTFALKYGTDTRSPEGVEPLTEKMTLRFAPSDVDIIKKAAETAGMTFAEYVRAAAMVAALKEENSS